MGVVQVSAGENHSAALTVDGRLLTWGRGKYGQLGLGDFYSKQSPCNVKALAGIVGVQVKTALPVETLFLADPGRGLLPRYPRSLV